MAGPLTESEELELLELELEEAQAMARAKPSSASPFLQKGMDMVSAAQASPEQPRTGKDGALDRKNAAISAEQTLRKTYQEQVASERNERVKPVEQAAGQAGQAAMAQERERRGTGTMDAAALAFQPPFSIEGLGAERRAYDDAGVMSPNDALTTRGMNSFALGAPAMLNKGFREEVAQAGQDHPGAALAGDIAGYLLPGEAAWQGGRMATNAFLRPLVNKVLPKGGAFLERGARVAERYAEQAAGWAGQNALFQGTIGESIEAAGEGRDPSLSSSLEKAGHGATDLFNIAGPAALMGVNRVLTWLRSGGTSITPKNIADDVSILTGGGSDSPQTTATQVLDMESVVGDPLRPQAIARVIRELKAGGLTRENIMGLFEAVNQRLSSLPEGQAGRLTMGQAMMEALERDFPQAAENILGTLRERRLTTRKGDRSPGIAGQVSRELRESQTDFLAGSSADNLGAEEITGTRRQLEAARDELGAQYEAIFEPGASVPTPESLAAVQEAIGFLRTDGRLMERLSEVAAGRRMTVNQYIEADPRRALHWMQVAAREIVEAERAAPTPSRIRMNSYGQRRDEMLRLLEDSTPGYNEVRSDFGSVEEIDTALDAGRRFLTRTTHAEDLTEFAETLQALSPEAQQAALASIRDEVLSMLGRAGEDAPARITQLTSANALRTLEALGPGGQALADDLRFLRREQRFLNSFDPDVNSRTALNAQAISGAQARGNSPLANAAAAVSSPGTIAQDALISGVAGQPLPIMTGKKAAGGILNNVFGPRIRTLEDQTRFYMSRHGNVPRSPEAPDFSGPRSRNNPSTMRGNDSGVLGAELASTLGGGGGGGIGGYMLPTDDPEQRSFNAFLGASAGLGLGVHGARVIDDAAISSRLAMEARAEQRAADAAFNAWPDLRKVPSETVSTPRPSFRDPGEEVEHLVMVRGPGERMRLADLRAELEAMPDQALELAATRIAGQRPEKPLSRTETIDFLTQAFQQRVSRLPRGNGAVAANAFAEAGVGSVGGSAYGSQRDLNDDGNIDKWDSIIGGAAGLVGLPIVTKGIRMGEGALARRNAFAEPRGAERSPDAKRLIDSIRDERMMTEGGDPVANAKWLDDWDVPADQQARPMGPGGVPLTREEIIERIATRIRRAAEAKQAGEDGLRLAMQKFREHATPGELRALGLDEPDDVTKAMGAFGNGSGNAGRYRFKGKAFNPWSSKVQDQIIAESGGTLSVHNIDEMMSWYTSHLLDMSPKEIVSVMRSQAGELPMQPDDWAYISFAELMAQHLSPMRRGADDVSAMGFAPPSGSDRRPSGFLDELERGTDTFHDPRLGKEGSNWNKTVEMAKNGFSNDEIADALDMSAGSIKVYLSKARAMGIDIPKGHIPGGAARTETGTSADVMRLKDQGLSVSQIAARTGKTKAQVYSAINNAQRRNAFAGTE